MKERKKERKRQRETERERERPPVNTYNKYLASNYAKGHVRGTYGAMSSFP